jgi:CheY-like chemotaxis protein
LATPNSSQSLSGRILIVDDNSLGLAARCSVLEELGHKVTACGAPQEALELCVKQRFDIVVTDYKMPKMDGKEFIRRLKKLNSGVSIILISGFADTLGLNEANTGADLVLQKSSHEVPMLIRSVSRLLRQRLPSKKPATSENVRKSDKRNKKI